MKKVMLVFGTRPEAIKMCPLVREFQKERSSFETTVCVTGQHREMLDQVLHVFGIKPDYDLNIMAQGQDLYDVTSKVLIGLRDILKEAKPDVVLVHGDTTTSMAAALAAFYQQIPVAHIEAGLRTHDIYSPWPEEMNRQITGRIASLNFSPTQLSRRNLLAEGVEDSKIYVVGNTVIDALHMVLKEIQTRESVRSVIMSDLETAGITPSLIEQWQNGRRMVLITGHRRENFGQGFLNICHAIKDLAIKYKDVDFVYPMHLNPNVRKPIMEAFGKDYRESFPNLYFIEPLDYLPFVFMMNHSAIVLTDSGGIQEEAPGLGKPVFVMRNTTERPEALDAGTVKLVGTDYDRITTGVSSLLDDEEAYQSMSKAVNPYGDGLSCQRIIHYLKSN